MLECVFLNAYSYIERPADFSAPERQPLPVKTGNIFRSRPAGLIRLNGEMETIEVGLAETPLGDLQKLGRLKLFEIRAHAAIGSPHVVRKFDLSGEACVLVPGIFEEHRIGELSADRDVLLGEDEVRDLGEAMPSDGIGADDFDVALFDEIADVTRLRVHIGIIRPTRAANRSYPLLSRDGCDSLE